MGLKDEKGREGGREIVRHLLENLDDESDGKIILKPVLSFKDLKCGINKNSVWLFESHKPSPRQYRNIHKGYGCDQ